MDQTAILYLAALLMDMSVAGVVFAISRRAAELGAHALELGLLGSVVFGAYAMCALIGGRISDRFGQRNIALVGCLLAATITLVCAFVTRVPILVGLSALFGLGMGCFWPSIIAWLGGNLTGAALARRMSNFGVAWNVGLLLGFLLTGKLFVRGARLGFFFCAGLIVVIALLLMWVRPGLSQPQRSDAGNSDERPVPKGRGFRKTAWLANFAVNFAAAGAVALFPQLAWALGIRADIHAALLALSRAAALAMIWAMQHAGFWRRRLWPLWAAQAACVVGIAWIGWGEGVGLFAVVFIVVGAVSGATYQSSVYFTLEEMSEKGKGGGVHEAVLGSGMFLGPILAGWVARQAGLAGHSELRVPYFFCAAALALLVAVQLVLVWLRRKRAAAATG